MSNTRSLVFMRVQSSGATDKGKQHAMGKCYFKAVGFRGGKPTDSVGKLFKN